MQRKNLRKTTCKNASVILAGLARQTGLKAIDVLLAALQEKNFNLHTFSEYCKSAAGSTDFVDSNISNQFSSERFRKKVVADDQRHSCEFYMRSPLSVLREQVLHSFFSSFFFRSIAQKDRKGR